MKPDERAFLRALAAMPAGGTANEVIDANPLWRRRRKRCWVLLEKWARAGWYEYRLNLEVGSLTDKGKAAADGC